MDYQEPVDIVEVDKNCFYCEHGFWCNFLRISPTGICGNCIYKQPKDFVINERKCEMTCSNLVENELCRKGPCYNDGRKPVCCFKCGWFSDCGFNKCTITSESKGMI